MSRCDIDTEEGTGNRSSRKARTNNNVRRHDKRSEPGVDDAWPVENSIDLTVVEEPAVSTADTVQADVAIVAEVSLAETAVELMAYTNFVDWMVAGPGTFIYLNDHQVILGQRVCGDGIKAIFVEQTKNVSLLKRDHVFSDELAHRASQGDMEYLPDHQKNQENEAVRVALFAILLPLIAKEGGHSVVLKKIRSRRGGSDNLIQHHVPGLGTFSLEAPAQVQ